jgi:hypothetical protein
VKLSDLSPLRALSALGLAVQDLVTLRWAGLMTDRRWAPPLAATAVAFGLFAGIAIGPGLEGTLGTVVPAGGSDESGESADSGLDSGSPLLGSPAGSEVGGGAIGAVPQQQVSGAPAPAAAPVPAPAPAPSVPPTEPTEEAKPIVLSGTVLQENPVSKSFALATGDGELVAIHAEKLPEPGAVVSKASMEELYNGTLEQQGKLKLRGQAPEATFEAVVTYRDAGNGAYTASSRGVSVLVHAPSGSPPAEPPPLGAVVRVTGAIEPAGQGGGGAVPTQPATPPGDCGQPPSPPPAPEAIVTERSVEVTDPFLGASYLEGIVQGVCPATSQVVLSADGLRESGNDIVMNASSDIQLYLLEPGQPINASAAIGEDGSYTITGASLDEGAEGADDPNYAQGDQTLGGSSGTDLSP